VNLQPSFPLVLYKTYTGFDNVSFFKNIVEITVTSNVLFLPPFNGILIPWITWFKNQAIHQLLLIIVCAELTLSWQLRVCLFMRVTWSKGILLSWLGTSFRSYKWEDWVLVGLCKWIFCLLHVGCFAFVYHLSVLRYFILFSQLSDDKVRRFFFIACFEMWYVVCLHVLKIYLRILRNCIFNLMLNCMSVFIYRESSFLILSRLWKCWLQLYCLLIAFFHHSFRCPYRELVCTHNCQHFKTQSIRLVVSAGCTGAGTPSQAKIYRPECWAQVALYSKRSHCTFASQYLARQHLYRLELIDVGSTWKWDIVRDCQRASEIVRNSQKPRKTVLQLHCTCIVRNTLEQY